MPDNVLELLDRARALIDETKAILAEADKIDLQFHQIYDIRQVYNIDPARKYWIVDYRVAGGCLPRSWRFDRLTDDSKRAVLSAYLDNLLGEDGADTMALDDICETLDKFFSDYWELIPEIKP